MGGRGSAGARGGASKILGGNSKVPTKDEILNGDATYGGLPVVYNKSLTADAENFTTQIQVSDKFFEHPQNIQQHILNHEVAHNLSDDMIMQNAGNWKEFSSAFLTEKEVPKTAPAYKTGQRTYWIGLYGDIGSNAIHESTTRAITEYLDDPKTLRSRSSKAYKVVDKYMKRKYR